MTSSLLYASSWLLCSAFWVLSTRASSILKGLFQQGGPPLVLPLKNSPSCWNGHSSAGLVCTQPSYEFLNGPNRVLAGQGQVQREPATLTPSLELVHVVLQLLPPYGVGGDKQALACHGHNLESEEHALSGEESSTYRPLESATCTTANNTHDSFFAPLYPSL